MNMKKMSGVSDYFVIASGTSTTHTRAIADHVADTVRAKGARVWRIEGLSDASWVLLDCGDVVVHIFLPEKRSFYGLENLWKKAPKERFKESGKPKARRKGKPASRKSVRKTVRRRKKS
jgi:ribosome-associated protein